jgi:DNA-binding CsgD family transcriptional regulator
MSRTWNLPKALRDYALGGKPLSQREVQILRLKARGLTSAQAAAELGIGYETVKSHLRTARSKLGADTTAQAIAVAISLDLI